MPAGAVKLAGMTSPPSFFDRLLQAASAEPEPQRLLFVFAQSELPADATAGQRAAYAAGQGGALVPLACVDKAPGELSTFDALADESRRACPPWQAVFVAALGGRSGRDPAADAVDGALQAMVENVRGGRFTGYLALGPGGEPLHFGQEET